METEPTLLYKVVMLLVQIVLFFSIMGLFCFFLYFVNCIIDKGNRESKGIFGGWVP